MLSAYLDKKQGKKGTHAAQIIKSVVRLAKGWDDESRPDMEAVNFIWDRVVGKPAQNVDVTSGGETLGNNGPDLSGLKAVQLKALADLEK